MPAKLFIYRIIDICDELDVNRLKKQLKKLEMKPLSARYFAPVRLNFATPPVEMDGRRWIFKPLNLPVETKIKFYSLGIATIRYELAIETSDYSSCFKTAQAIINTNRVFDKRTEAILKYIEKLIEKEMRLRIRSELMEDYSILWIQDKYDSQKIWLPKMASQFLRNETLSLSQYEQKEACRHQFSYTPDDLIIIDWDRTITIDAHHQEDVWDVLEYANIQLVELRYYEQALEKNLNKFYELIKKPRWKTAFGLYQTSEILKKVSALYLNFNEEENRLNDFLRLTGDEYLSRIYAAAAKRLNLRSFQETLKERLADTERLYEMLSDEASSLRVEALEIIIIFLIGIEIIIGIVK